MGYTQRTTLAHNDVSNLTYGALSIGWGWARHEAWDATNAGWNVISSNRIHDYKRTLNDGGGIYMLGPQNGSIIERNHVYDQGTPSSGALYPDEGSAYSVWRHNVVERIGTSKWLHLWTSSIHDIAIESNYADTPVMLDKGSDVAMIDNHVRPPAAAGGGASIIARRRVRPGAGAYRVDVRRAGLHNACRTSEVDGDRHGDSDLISKAAQEEAAMTCCGLEAKVIRSPQARHAHPTALDARLSRWAVLRGKTYT